MDSHTYENWKKIKETFEKSGNISNAFYERACKIMNTGVDPMQNMWNRQK